MKYDAALEAVLGHCLRLPTQTVHLMEAHRRALASDIVAPCALPALEIGAGQAVLTRGMRLDPERLAVLGTWGIATVPVTRRPRLLLVATGSALAAPGTAIGPGQLWDANTVALAAQAREAGAEVVPVHPVIDDPEAISSALGRHIADVDVVVATSGLSGEESAPVQAAFARLGVESVLWRFADVSVRFGSRGETLFFGLPGKPLDARSTFETLVRPALLQLQGLPVHRPDAAGQLPAPFAPSSAVGSGRAMPELVAVCAGGSNSGKTLWVCALVAALTRRGLRVGTVKHTHKDFDVPGKDSAQHRDAGAKRVILSASSGRSILVPEPETSLRALVATDLSDMDIVLAEGFRSAGDEIPKLFVGDPDASAPLRNIIGTLRRANAPIGAAEADVEADRLLALLGSSETEG